MSSWIREAAFVENKFLEQLESLGWNTLVIEDNDNKHRTSKALLGRATFKDVILEDVLSQKIKDINGTWLRDEQIKEVISTLKNINHSTLFENNLASTELLLENTSVDINHETGVKSPTVKYIDFDDISNNHFLAISQFMIDGAQTIIPDITLFVNGIPLVVIECKAPDITDPIHEGVNQLKRYMNTRGTQQSEGASKLFNTNAFVVVSCRTQAKSGTISSNLEHYLSWKDPYPKSLDEFGKDEQDILVAGMLDKQNLLEIMRNFIIVMGSGRKRVKVVCRYQQYRAVKKTIKRILESETLEDRNGVIWHTQGSGKSLTMVFLVRYSRTIKELQDYKILFIVDRSDLQEQLEETATLIGEEILVASNGSDLKKKLSNDISNINMTMMQKFSEGEFEKASDGIDTSKVIVLIDEAHRTQYSKFGSALRLALPDAVKIAFTGTPVSKTVGSFGSYIDTYKIKEAVEDGATVPIIYEGMTSKDTIKNRGEFDGKFEDLFADLTKEQIELIKKKYGTKGDILEAPKRIEVIAKNMVEHYIQNILPNGYKAQVVSSSRKAAIVYNEALKKALKEYYEDLEDSNPYKKLIGKLDSTVVISSKHNDNADQFPKEFSTKSHKDNSVASFKKPLFTTSPLESSTEDIFDPLKTSQLAFLVVSDMLLTGFDAPIEQVMYLDKKLTAHNLLQAIARVNRTYEGKTRGLIVDYYGVGAHLKEALANYEDADVEDVMQDFSSELSQLELAHRKAIQFFSENKIEEISEQTIEDAVILLADEKLRAEFKVLYKTFTKLIDFILPHPIKRYFLDDAKVLGLIKNEAHRRYRDEELYIEGIGEKVKKLINEHLESEGIETKVRPISIFDEEFEKALNGRPNKAVASEMEHALRYTIRINLEKDPIHYKSLAEKLEKIIAEHKGEWDKLVEKLSKFKEDMKDGREVLAVFKEMKCNVCMAYNDMFESFYNEDELTAEIKIIIIELVIESVQATSREIQRVDFWGSTGENARHNLENQLVRMIATTKQSNLIKNMSSIKEQFMSISKENQKALEELNIAN
ncbi:type I restriction enzyme [Malaciobacter pacificus]|uniref:Type I restriction enzyme endonuclease subunit n=1 Tax=Malaciobacter pacificus TaxID=1080223 RepID=A0A5C2H9K1_9BACT|nr:HsdR family type I site-specific deoxyribonuclease [Malaciobacter pacificus]QEP34888.1 type I restriction/modification system, restriction subunit [Malaciobacter pacificus]GGD47551.1 type I restriction enzyme [Malaciobacter pacificus]